ncbi:MAG TPA: SCP2 sterol-binding domain-containing protein [Thermoleophilaceae bacterium]
MAEPGIDPQAVDPAEFAKTIGSTPDEQLAAGMRSDFREQVLGEIFRRMEEHVDAERARGVEAVIHFHITGGPDDSVDEWEAVIENGACKVSDEPSRSPRVTLKMDGVDFLKLVSGNVGGPKLFMTGRLKIEGDLMFAASAAGLFRIP